MGWISSQQLKQEQQALVDNLKKGKLIPSNSVSAKSLDPVSEESGTIQDEPFIAQGTGTANGTASVDVPPVAKNLEKQGYTVVYNQQMQNFTSASDFYASNAPTTVTDGIASFTVTAQYGQINNYPKKVSYTVGHVCLGIAKVKLTTSTTDVVVKIGQNNVGAIETKNTSATTNWQTIYLEFSSSYGSDIYFIVADNRASGWDAVQLDQFSIIDLTQWFNGNIPQDLLDHPENFGRYYAGSLAYNTGTLTNTTGRYLVCTVGKDGGHSNLWDEQAKLGYYISGSTGEEAPASGFFCSEHFIPCIPKSLFCIKKGATQTHQFIFYDANKNFVSSLGAYNDDDQVFRAPANAHWMKFWENEATYNNDITVSLYYTVEQGGEGYDEYYPYVTPEKYDTGTETLKAFDYKTNDGVVHNDTGEYTITGNEVFTTTGAGQYVCTAFSAFWQPATSTGTKANIICDFAPTKSYDDLNVAGITDGIGFGDSIRKYLIIGSIQHDNWASYVGKKIIYEKVDADKTTTQGTSFAENIEDDDYGMMYWLDTDNELVETPQGCKIFYPANYSLWLDTAYARTEGDATDIALTSEISDTALNARGYYKMQDLSSDITDVAGLTYQVKKLYRIGNQVFLSIRARNDTGSSISANTNLFNLSANSVYPSISTLILSFVDGTPTYSRVPYESYKVDCGLAIPNGSTLSIDTSYAIG